MLRHLVLGALALATLACTAPAAPAPATAPARPTAPPAPPTAIPTPAPATLPGIDIGGIKVLLGDAGLECSATRSSGEASYLTTCQGQAVQVEIVGPSPLGVTSVSATAFDPDQAASLLPLVASLPIEDGSPTNARSWLAQNFDQPGPLRLEIGPASYVYFSSNGLWSLDVRANP